MRQESHSPQCSKRGYWDRSLAYCIHTCLLAGKGSAPMTHGVPTLSQTISACPAKCPPLPKHQGNRSSRMQGERGEELPPRASLAAHLRSGGATEPAIHPSGRGGAQAVRLAHRSRSSENRPGLTAPCTHAFEALTDAGRGLLTKWQRTGVYQRQ